MRHALRRVLWIMPTLFVISLITFWLLSAGAGFSPAHGHEEPAEHPLFGAHRPPRFLNPNPVSVRDLSLRAMQSIANDDERAAAARQELVRLGGAALPHVLPALDSLDPKGRGRVALALEPLGKRMGVGTPEELSTADSALVFWTRFWQDRAIEFRPAVVKRAVERLGQKSTTGRREDVRELDTYALPELVARMSPLDDAEDLSRVRRVIAVAAQIAEQPWRVSKDGDLDEARRVASQWRHFWLEHHADYVTFDGASRLLAMVSETEYGHWAAEAVENGLGTTASGSPVTEVMRKCAPVSLWLVLVGLLGGYTSGVLLGLVGAARVRRLPDFVTSALAVVLGALPIAALATTLAPASVGAPRRALGALIMVLASAAIVSRHQRAATRVALDQEYTRTARAFGAGPWRLALRSLRASSVATLSLLGVDLATIMTTSFVVEHALGLSGLASVTLLAVAARDVAWLMALSISVATVIALGQIASDSLLAALDPRVRVAMARKRGAVE